MDIPITLSDSTIALIAALFGGAGVRVLEKLLSKRSEYFTEAQRIREELRQDLEAAQSDATSARTEANEWRTKYWEAVELNARLKVELEQLRAANPTTE